MPNIIQLDNLRQNDYIVYKCVVRKKKNWHRLKII